MLLTDINIICDNVSGVLGVGKLENVSQGKSKELKGRIDKSISLFLTVSPNKKCIIVWICMFLMKCSQL